MKVPQISTRGYYDLGSGKTLKTNPYYIDRTTFENFSGKKEVTIMIHGLRNDRNGARQKFILAKNHLKRLGYPYPVLGFSYDSNTKGAHLEKHVRKSLRVGQVIAKKNARNLGQFILDLKKTCPKIRIRLLGHSLGSEVILSTINYLSKKPGTKKIIEQAYFFGSSVQQSVLDSYTIHSINTIMRKPLVNYYSSNDEVLKNSQSAGLLKKPIGLVGVQKKFKMIKQKKVNPKNHRFASYVVTIKKFP